MIFQIIILALALSIDAFGIGISYGIRKIDFKISSLFIISFISLLLSSTFIFLGRIITSIFSEKITSFISILILIILGLFIIKKGIEKDEYEQNNIEQIMPKNFIKYIKNTINIIKNPFICDMDKSLKIESKEAFYLGIALSIDCSATSIAISSFKDYILLFPILIVIFQLNFLLIGSLIGKKTIVNFLNEEKISTISGLILIVIGFIRLIFYN